MLPLHRNPIIRREGMVCFRPVRLLATLAIAFGLVGIVFTFVAMDMTDARGTRWTETFKTFSLIVIGIQILLASYAPIGISADAVDIERIRKTYDFLVTLPISPTDKTVGFAIGPNLIPLLLLGVMTPVSLAAGIAGELPTGALLLLYLVLATNFVAASLLGVSIGNSIGGLLGWFVILILLVIGAAMASMASSHSFGAVSLMMFSPWAIFTASFMPADQLAHVLRPGQCHFFGWTVPWQLCPQVLYVFVAVVVTCSPKTGPS